MGLKAGTPIDLPEPNAVCHAWSHDEKLLACCHRSGNNRGLVRPEVGEQGKTRPATGRHPRRARTPSQCFTQPLAPACFSERSNCLHGGGADALSTLSGAKDPTQRAQIQAVVNHIKVRSTGVAAMREWQGAESDGPERLGSERDVLHAEGDRYDDHPLARDQRQRSRANVGCDCARSDRLY